MTNAQAPMANFWAVFFGHWDLDIGHSNCTQQPLVERLLQIAGI
jgi:hypothetical protein